MDTYVVGTPCLVGGNLFKPEVLSAAVFRVSAEEWVRCQLWATGKRYVYEFDHPVMKAVLSAKVNTAPSEDLLDFAASIEDLHILEVIRQDIESSRIQHLTVEQNSATVDAAPPVKSANPKKELTPEEQHKRDVKSILKQARRLEKREKEGLTKPKNEWVVVKKR